MKITVTQLDIIRLIREKYDLDPSVEISLDFSGTDNKLIQLVTELKHQFPLLEGQYPQDKMIAIKWVREQTHCGLAEAKFFVEGIDDFSEKDLLNGQVEVTSSNSRQKYRFISGPDSVISEMI